MSTGPRFLTTRWVWLAAAGSGLICAAVVWRISNPLPARTSATPTPTAQRPNDPILNTQPSPPTTQPPSQFDPVQARLQVDRTIASAPKRYDYRMQAAEFYMRYGLHADAIPHLRVAAKLSPGQLLPWLALGDAACLTSQFDLSSQSYARAAVLARGHPLVLRGQGQLLVRQRRFSDARRVLESAYRQHPGHPEIAHALGNLLLALNKPAEARTVFTSALEQHSDRADLHYLLADAYERELHIEAALREAKEAVRLDPNMAEAWGRIGLYLVDLTRYQEAREPLERAIQLDPETPFFHWALGDSYLLDSSVPGGFEKGVSHHRQALKLDPRNEKALYSLAMALARRDNPVELKEAVTLLDRLVVIKPIDMNAHYKLFETHRRLGNADRARFHRAKFEALFEKGRVKTKSLNQGASFRDTPEVHVRLGRQALSRGELDLARREFELALERSPSLAAAQAGLRAVDAAAAKAGSSATPRPDTKQGPQSRPPGPDPPGARFP